MHEIEFVRTVHLIEVSFRRGTGIENDPYRIVKQYWDENGNLMAENDPEY